jgi:hypothetical protein
LTGASIRFAHLENCLNSAAHQHWRSRQSGAASATVVGVLIEVPVMLAVVAVVNRSQAWYEAGVRGAKT